MKCVLLDGAFDPIHAGHIAYIQAARLAFPNYQLVVSVCSDDDIRAKGREPLFDQATRRTVVGQLVGVDSVIIKDAPTEHLIREIKPAAYVKGADWEGKLPAEQLAACALHDVQIVYLNTVQDSSSGALRRWALRDAERGLSRLETFMAAQKPASTPWQPVTDYSFEARKQIEGPHPQLIKETFQPTRVLDVGCGTGVLVTLLQGLGVDARGCDKEPQRGHPWFFTANIAEELEPETAGLMHFDLVICREVLEHLTVQQIGRAVANLFRLSSRYVYITTRFTDAGVFDADTEFDVDPTHITCLSQPFLRALCVLNGGKRRADLETKVDHMNKGRVLVYEVH